METQPLSGEPPRLTIVGSGLAGALMACLLGKAGHRVDVYEKRSDPRVHGPDRGRSINLALSVRGIHALRQAGLADLVLAQAIPMRGRMIHARSGRLTFQPYGKDDSESIHSVSRADLNLTLIEAAARCGPVRLFFNHKCTGIDLDTAALELHDSLTQETYHVPARTVIAADGVHSAVRAQMQKQERFDYRQDYLAYGYKELSIPPGPGGSFPLEKQALHIWPRQSFMMIALPNRDGSFTCTLFLPCDGVNSFAGLQTEADLRRFFEGQFPDAVSFLPNLVTDFTQNPTGPLVTIRCRPWHVADRVVLLGDASHAVVPFLGQGMNAAFEDCSVLHQCLVLYAPDRWTTAFQDYETRRKPNVDTLADLCLGNFIEMRDRVSSRLFLLKKKFEILLHRLFPRWFVPLYVLVTFTRTPYAEALRRAKRQGRVMGGVIVLTLVLLALGAAALVRGAFQ
jgi:kynurenine 3-monooxygenase